MISKYKIDGKVLILPIQGSGKSNLTLGKLQMFLELIVFYVAFFFITFVLTSDLTMLGLLRTQKYLESLARESKTDI